MLCPSSSVIWDFRGAVGLPIKIPPPADPTRPTVPELAQTLSALRHSLCGTLLVSQEKPGSAETSVSGRFYVLHLDSSDVYISVSSEAEVWWLSVMKTIYLVILEWVICYFLICLWLSQPDTDFGSIFFWICLLTLFCHIHLATPGLTPFDLITRTLE